MQEIYNLTESPNHACARRWTGKAIHKLESSAFQKSLGAIESQDAFGDSPNRRHPLDLRSQHRKMLRPFVGSWIKEPHEDTALPMYRANVTSFRLVAKQTGVAQIICLCWPTMLFANNMIDFATEEGIHFRNQAILADAFCPSDNETSEFRIDVGDRHGATPRSAVGGRGPWPVA